MLICLETLDNICVWYYSSTRKVNVWIQETLWTNGVTLISVGSEQSRYFSTSGHKRSGCQSGFHSQVYGGLDIVLGGLVSYFWLWRGNRYIYNYCIKVFNISIQPSLHIIDVVSVCLSVCVSQNFPVGLEGPSWSL